MFHFLGYFGGFMMSFSMRDVRVAALLFLSVLSSVLIGTGLMIGVASMKIGEPENGWGLVCGMVVAASGWLVYCYRIRLLRLFQLNENEETRLRRIAWWIYAPAILMSLALIFAMYVVVAFSIPLSLPRDTPIATTSCVSALMLAFLSWFDLGLFGGHSGKY